MGTPWEIFQRIYQTGRNFFFLDSIDYHPPAQNYSYLGADPFLELTLKSGRIVLRGEMSGNFPDTELIPLLRKIFKKYQNKKNSSRHFFSSGAVGFFGYEMARYFDRIHFREKPTPATPLLYLGFYRDVVVYDHRRRVYCRAPSPNRGQTPVSFVRGLTPIGEGAFSFRNFRPEIPRAKFESMIHRAKAYIAAGDIYQANLSQRFSFDFSGSPLELYGRLREINPSPFASFLRVGDLHMISSSPERLILKKGRYAETKPIAGTRPRPVDRKKDKRIEQDLFYNEKERAEHLMLVDLERNDLGRVCDYRSVKVAEFMKVEKYSHVMHLVSKITGRMVKEKDGLDLLRAVFPGGTITGCPKIRCMEIIDELEPVGRGLYTGSIGYLDFNGDLDLNIVIRTLILERGRGHLQVGAGIVHDSDPAREYEETLAKGEALAEALVMANRQ